MTERDNQSRLRTARWVVVGAVGLVALLMGTVAFAAAALPGQKASYSDLPVVHVASTTASATNSAAARIGAASTATTVAPLRATRPTTLAPAPAPRASTSRTAPKSNTTGASSSSNGNTLQGERVVTRNREVISPEVRVQESDGGQGGEGSSGQ